jgi:hypothetical protein
MATAVQKRLKDLTLYNVQLVFKNFMGAEKQFNPAGQRNFSILIDPASAQDMLADGWNVKFLKPREGDDPNEPPQAHLPVKVRYTHRPPTIVMVTERSDGTKSKTPLAEDMVGALDYVVMKEVDIIINPSSWEYSGRKGVTAYCKSLYVTIEMNDLDRKYADIPEIGPNGEQLSIEAAGGDFEDLGELGHQYELEA